MAVYANFGFNSGPTFVLQGIDTLQCAPCGAGQIRRLISLRCWRNGKRYASPVAAIRRSSH